MNQLLLTPIGKIKTSTGKMLILLDEQYIPTLRQLDGFSHIIVLWWFNGCDNEASRNTLTVKAPYKHSPSIMGTFATRSPERPNPIAVSVAEIVSIDHLNGVIDITYLDANDNSPLIDLKPYTPSLDRVEKPHTPAWCSHWPRSLEESASFNWQDEFNF